METNENEHTTTKTMDTVKAVLREVHSNKGVPKRERKISNKQPIPTSKRTRGTKASNT